MIDPDIQQTTSFPDGLRSWQTEAAASDVTYMDEQTAQLRQSVSAMNQSSARGPDIERVGPPQGVWRNSGAKLQGAIDITTPRRLSAELPPRTESVFNFSSDVQPAWASEQPRAQDLGGTSGSGQPVTWSTVNLPLPRTSEVFNGGLAGAMADASRLDVSMPAGESPGSVPSLLPNSSSRLEPTPPLSTAGSAQIVHYDPAMTSVPRAPASSPISVVGEVEVPRSRGVSFANVPSESWRSRAVPGPPRSSLKQLPYSSSKASTTPPWSSSQINAMQSQLPPEDSQTKNMEWALLCAREDQLQRRLSVLESLASCASQAEEERQHQVEAQTSKFDRDFNQNFLRFPMEGFYVDRTKIPHRETQLYHHRMQGEDHPHIYAAAGASRRAYFSTNWAIDQRAWRKEHTFHEVNADEYLIY